MKKRLFSVLLTSAMVLAMLTACSCAQSTDSDTPSASTGTETDAAIKEPVKVILNEVAHSIFYAPMYVAIEEGYFLPHFSSRSSRAETASSSVSA